MKSAENIIKHLRKKPLNHKMVETECFEKIKSMLPQHLQNSIMFIYKKNQTLYFALNHPGMKMEFHYKHSLIKSLLNKLKDYDDNCKDIEINDIKSFVSNKIASDIKMDKPKRFYIEKSSGNFSLHTNNPKLIELFKMIQDEIQSKI